MGDYQIPEHLVILRTAHWILNHRMDSALPGHLMLGARTPVNELSLMHPDALMQLGALMASTQKALNEILAPAHLYISRYGHAPGHALHFHIIPVCGWVRQRFSAILDTASCAISRRLRHRPTPTTKPTAQNSRSVSGANFVKIPHRRRFPGLRYTTSLKGSKHSCPRRNINPSPADSGNGR
jgi:diadenosine tetraphosphate (Ap4A) HIT family hydrolase